MLMTVSHRWFSRRPTARYDLFEQTIGTSGGRLPSGCQQNDEFVAERCRFVQQQANQRLSTDQLRCLIEVYGAVRQGRPLTSEELAAVNALNTATEEECRKAGIALAEFKRNSRAATQAAR
jgi:hypothetical protein